MLKQTLTLELNVVKDLDLQITVNHPTFEGVEAILKECLKYTTKKDTFSLVPIYKYVAKKLGGTITYKVKGPFLNPAVWIIRAAVFAYNFGFKYDTLEGYMQKVGVTKEDE